MITQASNRDMKIRVFPSYGDAALLHSCFTTDFWKNLFLQNKLAVFQVLKSFLYWNIALFMSMATMVFRHQHGQRTTGFILWFSTVVTLLVFNSTEIIHFLKPFAYPMVFVFPFFIEGQLYNWVFTEIHSFPLLVFTGLYAVMGLVQCIVIYTGNGNPSLTKRGNSYLFLLLSKWGLKNELFVQAFLEPLLLGLGATFFYLQGDFVFAFVLGASAFSVLIPEIIDHAHTEKSMAAHGAH